MFPRLNLIIYPQSHLIIILLSAFSWAAVATSTIATGIICPRQDSFREVAVVKLDRFVVTRRTRDKSTIKAATKSSPSIWNAIWGELRPESSAYHFSH